VISSLELAKMCGGSQGTGDRALHDRPGVSRATRARILETARKLGYRPNPTVLESLGRSRRTIGAIVPALNGIFFMDLMNTIRQTLAEDDYRLLITQVTQPEEFFDALEEFAARKMRAAIVIPPADDLKIPDTITRDLPIVSLLSPCRGNNVLFLAPDEIQTGRDAVDYLTKKGHDRILHLTYPRELTGIRDRAKGYRQRMIELGLRPRVRTIASIESLDIELQLHKPTAIFCHNDWLAMRILPMATHPHQISVLGVDNSPTFYSLFPDLTTMEYPAADIAKYINAWLNQKTVPFTFKPFKIIERKTVATLAWNLPLKSGE